MVETNLPVLILGTRTFAEEVADVVSEIPGVRVAGFVENMDKGRCERQLASLPVYWVSELSKMSQTHAVICGLGTTVRSRYVEQVREYGIPFATLVHPSARVSAKTSVSEGTFVSCQAVIAAYTHVGGHVSINRGALIGHHTVIGSFVTVGPGANIAGNSRVGDSTYIGMGAVVLDHIHVGSHSVIAAGAVVARNVPDNVQAAGIPARIVKENMRGK